jgi:hypothetical protein
MLDNHHPLLNSRCLTYPQDKWENGRCDKEKKNSALTLHLTAQERSVFTSVSLSKWKLTSLPVCGTYDKMKLACSIKKAGEHTWPSQSFLTKIPVGHCLFSWTWKAPQKLSHNVISNQKKKTHCASLPVCVCMCFCACFFPACACVFESGQHRKNKLTLNSCDLCS